MFRSTIPSGALEVRPAYSAAPYNAPASPSFSFGPAADQQPAAKSAPEPGAAFRRLDYAAPLALTTPLLAVGRVWHAHGAAGSLGYVVGFGALSAVAALVGCAAGSSPRVQGSVLGVAGGLASMAVAGYAASSWPSLVMWALGTAVGYAVSWSAWRGQQRVRQQHAHERELKAMECSTELQKTVLATQAAIRVEEIRADAVKYTADRYSAADAAFAPRYHGTSEAARTQAQVADAGMFALSPTAREALGLAALDGDVLDVVDVAECELA